MFLPNCEFGPLLNFIGGPFGPPEQCSAPGRCKRIESDAPWTRYPQYCTAPRMNWLVEQVEPGRKLFPPDIFTAQLERRHERRQRGLPALG